MSLGYRKGLVSAQGDGPTLTAAAAATCLPGQAKVTIPGGTFDAPGKLLLIKASGRISSLITTPGTARFDVRLGGTVLFDSLAILLDTVAAHTTVGWTLDIQMSMRTAGTAATFWGQGTWTCEDILGVPATAPKGVLSAILPWNTTPAVSANTFDATAANVLDLFFTQTVATGSLTLHQYMAEIVSFE
jgi:hypothetical protein